MQTPSRAVSARLRAQDAISRSISKIKLLEFLFVSMEEGPSYPGDAAVSGMYHVLNGISEELSLALRKLERAEAFCRKAGGES